MQNCSDFHISPIHEGLKNCLQPGSEHQEMPAVLEQRYRGTARSQGIPAVSAAVTHSHWVVPATRRHWPGLPGAVPAHSLPACPAVVLGHAWDEGFSTAVALGDLMIRDPIIWSRNSLYKTCIKGQNVQKNIICHLPHTHTTMHKQFLLCKFRHLTCTGHTHREGSPQRWRTCREWTELLPSLCGQLVSGVPYWPL